MKSDYRNSFKKNFDEEVFSMIEVLHHSWSEIMIMPYYDMVEILKKKGELEQEKLKKMKEQTRSKRKII